MTTVDTDLMQGMSVQHLRFIVEPTESITFNANPGSALRGALYQALTETFGDHVEGPVHWLLAAENRKDERGRNIPRPLAIEPPETHTFHPGESLPFGVALIGKAQDLFPYLARAVQRAGSNGVGVGRGRFKLASIEEWNPLLDVSRVLMDGNFVKKPTLQVTSPRIVEVVAQLPTRHVSLEFKTPLRLTANGQLHQTPSPDVLVQRLIERCQRLADYYAETDTPTERQQWIDTQDSLLAHIREHVTIGVDFTAWQEGWSNSRRQRRKTPVGGLVGMVRWDGDVAPLLPWLLWGQSLHVGKSAVKGNGWYRVLPE
jgi:hypothetical protein